MRRKNGRFENEKLLEFLVERITKKMVRKVTGRGSCVTATIEWFSIDQLPYKLKYPEINVNYEITLIINFQLKSLV